MSINQLVVAIGLGVISSWSHASTSFLRGEHLYEVTDTGGSQYVTSQVQTTCGEFFTRRGDLHRLENGDYEFVVSDVTVVDPPFLLVGTSLKKIDSDNRITSVAEDVSQVRYPYYLSDGELYYWDGGSGRLLTDGVTQLERRGFLKKDRAFLLSANRFEEISGGVTRLAIPYYLKGDSLHSIPDGWIASGVNAVSRHGYFLRGDVVYEVEPGGTYRYSLSGVSQILGRLALAGDGLWLLSPGSSRSVATGVAKFSEDYFLENDRLYRMEGDSPVYLGAGVTELPCSGTLPIYLE